MSCGLMWFREDLRVEDNTALSAARDAHDKILAVYVIDHAMWQLHDIASCRVAFILRNLAALKEALNKKNIELLVIEIGGFQQLVQVFHDLIDKCQITELYFNEQYELNEARRDARIKKELPISVNSFMDQCIFHPQAILTQSNTPYTIFTPYKRNFLQRISGSINVFPLSSIEKCEQFSFDDSLVSHWKKKKIIFHLTVPVKLGSYHSDVPSEYWPGGEVYAHKRLQHFVEEKINDYQDRRDFPSLKATSKLSAYLACGVLSSRQCFSAVMNENGGRLYGIKEGIATWVSELIWREFYKQILFNFPHVSMNQAFKQQTESWPWRHDSAVFNAWAEGKTGYPLIDAAMRQLHQTGWMHNRLRMVVAMFLTKDCFIDWRWGEKFFMQHLIDGDLAANNGGWQWAASTGCDAVPYFRVFNPVRQSERFDSEGTFIKTYCPELKEVPIKQLHDPFKLPAGLDYPKPVVDYRNTRRLIAALIPKIVSN
ncbi:MAG: deoxyribodipyrimidine photo-lyase [Pseudomonadota bacterium]